METKPQEGKGELRSRSAQLSAHATRHVEMPWLQNYDSEVPETLPLPKQLLHELLSNAAREFPDRPALIFFGQKIGYRELDRLSNRFAHALSKLGIKKGDRVAIVLPNIPQCVIAFYGTLKAGAVVVLGSPLSNEIEIAYQVQHSGAQVLLTLSSYRALVERVCTSSNIRQVIYTNVREYLPVRQRVKLASLIDETGNTTRLATFKSNMPTTNAATGNDEGSTGLESVSTQPVMTAGQNSSKGSAQVTSIMRARASLHSTTWKQYDFQQLLRSQPMTHLSSGTDAHDLHFWHNRYPQGCYAFAWQPGCQCCANTSLDA
jgi:hypothetical protein